MIWNEVDIVGAFLVAHAITTLTNHRWILVLKCFKQVLHELIRVRHCAAVSLIIEKLVPARFGAFLASFQILVKAI